MTKNSTSFKKGQSGNPKGRPPISYLRKESLNHMLETATPEIKEIVANIILQAKQGNIQASRLLFDYILPKPKIEIEDDPMTTSIEIVEVMKELHGKVPIEHIDSLLSALKNIEEKKRLNSYAEVE